MIEEQKAQVKKNKKLIWKKWWVWLIIIFVIIIIASTGGDKKEKIILEDAISTQEVVFDIPAILGLNAFEIINTLTEIYGEPNLFIEPINDIFGTVVWTDNNAKIQLGFDYYLDGTIADNALTITGAREDGHTVNSVLQAGNLQRNAENYRIEDESGDLLINIWVLLD